MDGGGTGHSIAYNPITNTIYEINHPLYHLKEGWKEMVKGNIKSEGYRFNMSNEYEANTFWNMPGRGQIKLSPVWIPNSKATVNFFESYVRQSWDYNSVTNNCKHYIIKAFIAGGASNAIHVNGNPYPKHTISKRWGYLYNWQPQQFTPQPIDPAKTPAFNGPGNNNGGPSNWAKL